MKKILQIVTIILLAIVCCLIVFATLFVFKGALDDINALNKPKTTELTIEHLWTEDSRYYFADSNGSVYKLGNYRKHGEKIMYDNMPKQRFEILNEGSRYEIEYISGLDNWISISEKEL